LGRDPEAAAPVDGFVVVPDPDEDREGDRDQAGGDESDAAPVEDRSGKERGVDRRPGTSRVAAVVLQTPERVQ
jgi:hypothetical protein